MLPVKSLFVPSFSSQRGSSQRDGPDQTLDRTPRTGSPSARCQRDARGNTWGNVHVRGAKNRIFLKVKLQKVCSTLSKMEDKAPRRWTGETTVSRQGAASDSESVGRDVFFFSQRPTSTAINEKAKAKLAVLRTISKMLEENKLIRQRLATVSQANGGCMD